jgi:hypothetical protein
MFSRLDEISVVVGSSVMLIQVNNGDYQYQPITPDKVWVIFGEQIETNEELIPVDKLKLDHAQCVIIQMDEKKYAAYFGRSDMYETGRFVQYEASSPFSIPAVGSQDINEYMIGEEIYNPLTYQQDSAGDYTTPEYPIATWQGTTQGIGTELLPVQTNLYEIAKEIDLSSSRVAMSANKAARGAWFFTNEGGASPNQPASLDEGIAKLEAGQSVMVLSVPAANIGEATKVIDDLTVYLADQYSVPTYMLKVGDRSLVSGNTMPSGAALLELNKPQVKFEHMRRDINSTSMDRIFQIEKALAGIENGTPVGTDIEQIWTLRPASILKTDLEKLAEAKLELEMELTDRAHVLSEKKGITVEEAQEELDALVIAPVASTTANRVFG